MKLHGMHWVRLLILLQLAKKIEGRSLFAKRSIATNHELPTKLVDHIAYEERSRVKEVVDQQEAAERVKDVGDQQKVPNGVENNEDLQEMPEKAKVLEDQHESLNGAKDVEDQQEVVNDAQNVENQKKVPNRAQNEDDQLEVPIKTKKVEDQEESSNTARDVEEQLEVSKTKDVGDQQIVSNRAENVDDQQDVPIKLKLVEDQQELPNRFKAVGDQTEMSDWVESTENQHDVTERSRNVIDQQEVLNRVKYVGYEQKASNGIENIEGKQEVPKKVKLLEDQHEALNRANDVKDQQYVAQYVEGQIKVPNGAQNEDNQLEVPIKTKQAEDQEESLNTARDVEEQLEVLKTNDVKDQQIVPNRAENVADQQEMPEKLKVLEGQPKVRQRFKDVENQQEMSNGAQNAEYQQKVRNGANNEEDQRANGAKSTKYQQEVTERAKNVIDEKEALKRAQDVGDQQKIPNSTEGVEDQQKVFNGIQNIEDQQELLEKLKALEKQREALYSAKDVGDQLEMSNGAQKVEDQLKVPKGARNEKDQQELPEKVKLPEQEALSRAEDVEDQQEVIKKAKDEGAQMKAPERVNNVGDTSSGPKNVEEKQKSFNRSQNIVGQMTEVTEVAKNVEHQRVVPNRANNVGDHNFAEIMEELLLKSQLTIGDKALDGLLPSNFYHKTKPMDENETNSKYATKETTDKRPIKHAISAENYTANEGIGELHKDESARENLKKNKLATDINGTGAKNLHPQESIRNEAVTGSKQEEEEKKLKSQNPYDFENFRNVSSFNASAHALVAENSSSDALINNNKMRDVQQRHATLPVHIYSTAEGADDHPIDRLSLDIKNIGSNETLQEQLDFLQNNAENIKRQQSIVDEGGVNIIERTEGADKVATGATTSVTISGAQDGYRKPAVHPNQAEINNNKMKANGSLELSISPGEAIEFNEKAVASYTSEFTPNGTEPHESLSHATSNSNAIEVATKKVYQNVSTAASVMGIELQDSFMKSVIQPLVPNNKVNHISSSNESLELPKPLRHLSESSEQAAIADTSYFGLGSTKVSTNQHSSNTDLSKMEASTQNSSIADATAGSETVFKESTSTPIAAVAHNNAVNYATSNNTSLELSERLQEKTETNEYEFNTSLTRPHINSISLKLETNLPEPVDLKNTTDTKVDTAYSDSSTTAAVSALDASELANYASSPHLSQYIQTINTEDAFSRLTEIFDEYSIPIASVVQQLSSNYEITPVESASAESTKLSGSSQFQASEPITQIHERPDVVVDSKSPDAADFEEDGYGSGYTILQSQANFANYANLSSSAEQANYEEVSDKNQPIEAAYSQEEYVEEYAEQEENAVEAQLMGANQQSMAADYQSVASVESEESEYEVDEPSITEKAIANAQTTKTVLTKATTSAIVASTLPLPVNSQPTANEQTNYLEYLKMAIEQFLRKEIENIDKTNELQVESIHADHSNYADSQLPAESTNDIPTWGATATGLQHISATHWPQQNKHGAAVGVKGELMRVQMPEVMCSKTGIIKSEQYNKTNENGNGNEIEIEVQPANGNENKIENGNGKKKAAIPGRVLLERSVSYTVSCHIKLHAEPETITPAVHGTNDTTDDGIDNLQQKNHDQLTITSAAGSSNTLPVMGFEHEHEAAETIDAKEQMGWHAAMNRSSNAAYKADKDNSDEGVVVAVDSGGGNYDDARTENSEEENVENFYAQRHGIESEIYDSDAYAASHEDSEASLPAVGIQSRVRHDAADVTAFVQSPISLATSNDKTYEYWYHANRRQPLQGDGVTDKNATQTSVGNRRMTTGVNSENTTNTKPTDSGDAVGVAMADEHVTHDYERDNSSDGRHAAAIAGTAAGGAAAAHVGKIDVDATINVDGFSQMSHLHRRTDKSDISDDDANADDGADAVADDFDKLHYVAGAGAKAIRLLKIETKSTELENVSAQDTDANNNGGDEAADNIVAVGVAAEVGAAEAVGAIEVADMAEVNWGAANADTDADVATNAVANATKANTPNDHRE